jgi:hypothetical protein
MLMKRNRTSRGALCIATFLALSGLPAAFAQYVRPAVPGAAGAEPKKSRSDDVRIRRLVGVGRQTLVRTPEYRTSAPKSSTRAAEWARVSLTYDTFAEWLDVLTVRYFVLGLTREKNQNRYSLYRLNVEYLDVARGRGHLSTVFLRPNTVKRYGMPVAVHVDILLDGKVADAEDDLDPGIRGQLPPDWWQNKAVLDSTSLTVRDGYLLNRKETPFAFVNCDDHEAIR